MNFFKKKDAFILKEMIKEYSAEVSDITRYEQNVGQKFIEYAPNNYFIAKYSGFAVRFIVFH